MRNDLQGLEISDRELQQLTNLPVNYELVRVINIWRKLGKKFIDNVQGSEAATTIFMGVSSVVIVYFLFSGFLAIFMHWLKIPTWLLFLLLIVVANGAAQLFLHWNWQQQQKLFVEKITPTLKILLSDVERYNNAIRAIHINDELEAAGNHDVRIRERDRVISALELTRVDLVRALKTERIMRENKKFIVNNVELFADNLATLSALQVKEKASEHGKLLNEALEIALDVQLEMRRLQEQG